MATMTNYVTKWATDLNEGDLIVNKGTVDRVILHGGGGVSIRTVEGGALYCPPETQIVVDTSPGGVVVRKDDLRYVLDIMIDNGMFETHEDGEVLHRLAPLAGYADR